MQDVPSADGKPLAEITTAIVGLYRQYYGKGATKARTQMVGDTIICELEDFFTPVERTLVERGEGMNVRETRTRFQDALESEFAAVVERLTERKVRAFLSQTRVEPPQIAVEVFILEPQAAPDTP